MAKFLIRSSTFLLLFLLALQGVELLSVPNKPASTEAFDDEKAADLLDLANAADVKAACPTKDTYCLPRVKCPVKNTDYDRESLRFILADSELFKDRFGCGAFTPTWTYVCCTTLDKVDASTWTISPEQWFLPPQDGSVAKSVDPSAAFPVLLPWPGYNVTNSNATISSTTNSSTIKKEDEKTSPRKDSSPSNENKQPTSRSIVNTKPTPLVPVQQPMPSFPFMMNDPRFNPWFMMMNPNNFMMANQQQNRAFGMIDPWMMQQQPMAPPMMMPPQDQPLDWSEMILVFPDGSALRQRRPQMVPADGLFLGNPMDQQLRPDAQQMKPITMESSGGNEQPSRIRRAATDDAAKSFKLPTATGGMWTGNVTSDNKTDAEGRALMPRPNMQWGTPPGSTVNMQNQPVPTAFNVNSDRCGLSSATGINARVLAGRKPGSQLESETSFGEFPWHAAVVNGQTGDYLCAATIISARFVLTVAHCVRKFQLTLLFVRVGDWDLSSTREMLPSYDVEVQSVQIHEDFYAGNMQNDIALLQLKYPLDFNLMPHVGSICLPPSSDPIYSDCIVTGWGQQVATSEGKGDVSSFSRTLKQTSQSLVTAQFCEKSLRPFLGQFYQLPKKGVVCAYDKDGKDSCFGDGGGALACLVNAPNYPKPMQYHVVGLVSWGVGCGMPAVPSAYAAVWDYLDWIRAKVSTIDPYPMVNTDPLNRENNPPILPIMGRSNPVEDSPSTTTVRPTTSTPRPTTTMRATQPPTPKTTQDFIDLAFH